MVRVILVPKFEQQCAMRIAKDEVCTKLLGVRDVPLGGRVRIAICQDGRTPGSHTELRYEADYFKKLYHSYLERTDIDVNCYTFSYVGTPAQLRPAIP